MHEDAEFERVLQRSHKKNVLKTEFPFLETVETALALVVLEYTMGTRGFEEALMEMKMEASRHHKFQAEKATYRRLARSKINALKSSEIAYNRYKIEVVTSELKRILEEDLISAAGHF